MEPIRAGFVEALPEREGRPAKDAKTARLFVGCGLSVQSI
jgi:hypothetical protein